MEALKGAVNMTWSRGEDQGEQRGEKEKTPRTSRGKEWIQIAGMEEVQRTQRIEFPLASLARGPLLTRSQEMERNDQVLRYHKAMDQIYGGGRAILELWEDKRDTHKKLDEIGELFAFSAMARDGRVFSNIVVLRDRYQVDSFFGQVESGDGKAFTTDHKSFDFYLKFGHMELAGAQADMRLLYRVVINKNVHGNIGLGQFAALPAASIQKLIESSLHDVTYRKPSREEAQLRSIQLIGEPPTYLVSDSEYEDDMKSQDSDTSESQKMTSSSSSGTEPRSSDTSDDSAAHHLGTSVMDLQINSSEDSVEFIRRRPLGDSGLVWNRFPELSPDGAAELSPDYAPPVVSPVDRVGVLEQDRETRMLMRLALMKLYPSASLSFIDNQMMVIASPLGATPARFRESQPARNIMRITPPVFGSGPGGWNDAFKEPTAQPRCTSTRKEDLPRAASRLPSPMETSIQWSGGFSEAGSFLYKRSERASSTTGFYHRKVDLSGISDVRMDISADFDPNGERRLILREAGMMAGVDMRNNKDLMCFTSPESPEEKEKPGKLVRKRSKKKKKDESLLEEMKGNEDRGRQEPNLDEEECKEHFVHLVKVRPETPILNISTDSAESTGTRKGERKEKTHMTRQSLKKMKVPVEEEESEEEEYL